jgi:hypothetical protein
MISSHEDGWESGLPVEDCADADFALEPCDSDECRDVYDEVRDRCARAYYDGCVFAKGTFSVFCDFLTDPPLEAQETRAGVEWVRRHRSVLETMFSAIPPGWGVTFAAFAHFVRRHSRPCSIFCG